MGLLLLAGLWTPVAGAVLAFLKVLVAVSRCFSHSGDPWIPAIEAVFGAALAMIGPGAWSVDAQLFGRKRIDFPDE
jgi:putative oxidoreductase